MIYRNSLRRFIYASAVFSLTVSMSDAFARSSRKNTDFTSDGKPNIRSSAALVIDLKTNTVLFERDADLVRPIASISKLFAALVYMEDCKLDPEETHTMTTANREAARGSDRTRLMTGWTYSHNDILHAALMRSDNRGMPALAEACGFDAATFAEKMTEKAQKLGLTKTRFREPNGLSPENVSTAREVMVALQEAIKIPTLTEIMGTQEYTIYAHKNNRTQAIKIRNSDRLLAKHIAEILAGKTGFTNPARYCLAVAARTFDGEELGMVFLGAEGHLTRFADFTRVVKWVEKGGIIAKAETKPAAADASISPMIMPLIVPLIKPLETMLHGAAIPQATGSTQQAGMPNSISVLR